VSGGLMESVSSLNLPKKVQKLLLQHDIGSIDDLVRLCRRELGDLPGIGKKSIDLIEKALFDRGLSLTHDPWGPYICARHGQPRGDSGLESLFLCDECASDFKNNAFRETDAEYVGPSVRGYCLHCNRYLEDVHLRQWYLCGVCNRVVRSIGRSIAANGHVSQWWEEKVKPHFPRLNLELTDPPELQPRDKDQVQAKVSQVDFTCIDTQSGDAIFGIELKTGRSHIHGSSIGSKMAQFQLDNSDCDDILSVVHRERIPVYVLHAQVIDRADPPTVRYVPVGLWWTDLFSMRDHFKGSKTRPRETRIAAYYDVRMFQQMDEFIEHLRRDGPQQLRERIEAEGVPQLYRQ